ncbi:hypothetical protein V8J82_05925 [Gymnodinialimonas sp. 2305UL16-5]|uniref:hypothetical protein n=1 Tax=Gymnodinialimonas mytili TaxID=3126503 RepID=UPI003095919C
MSDDYDWTRYLQEKEEILWQGRPDGRFRILLMRLDYVMLAIPIPILLGSYFMMLAPRSVTSASFLKAALMVALSSLAYSFARPWFDTLRRNRLRYAITNHRAMRVDKAKNLILSQKRFRPGMTVEEDRHQTVRLDPSETEVVPVPMDWRFFAAPNKSISLMRPGNRRHCAINGYDERGLEFRMIDDSEHVKNLLTQQISMAAP